jgi:hypothetical protein
MTLLAWAIRRTFLGICIDYLRVCGSSLIV